MKPILEDNFTKSQQKEKRILEGVFQQFAPVSYPGRIYGLYDWDWKKHKWVVNKEFAARYNINI